MVSWIMKKLFYSKAMKKIRKGFWLEAYYEGKNDERYNELLKGLDKK